MLAVDQVSRRFDNGDGLARLDLQIAEGEIVALLGASGCGKSTLLRLIGGLDRPTAGRITLDGQTIDSPRPQIGLVFQEPRLMPWLTVLENVGFGLWDRPKAEREARARALLEVVGLADAADRLPQALSGGMAQRTALARALVTRPRLLLLDEPFSALDALTRRRLQAHLLETWEQVRCAMLIVTHDVAEAVRLADRIVVLGGRPGAVRRVAANQRGGRPGLAEELLEAVA